MPHPLRASRFRQLSFAAVVAVAGLGAGFLPSLARAKTHNTYFSDADIAAIRARAARPEYAAELAAARAAADPLLHLTDEEIWALVPAPETPRALNVRFGFDCPIHGKEIFQAGGHYPWIISADHPYQLECPVGHETYPSNNYAAWLKAGGKEKLDTTQKYVDDGNGWIDPEGNRYYFAAYYTFWQIWRHTVMEGTEACSRLYLATGDPVYAHKAAVCLARLSQIYPRLDFAKQGIQDGKRPAGLDGRINYYTWENAACGDFARAWDAIFPALAADRALHAFVAARGVPDLNRAIRQNILQVEVADIFAHKIWGNKFEYGSLSTLALVLDNSDPAQGPTSRQMYDWLVNEDEFEYTLYNGIDRDGIGGESSPMYSGSWNSCLLQVADNFGRLGFDLVKDRKWLRVAKGPAELRVLDDLGPRIGDTDGDIRGRHLPLDPMLMQFAVKYFHDADSARRLLALGGGAPATVIQTGPDKPLPRVKESLFSRLAASDDELRTLAAQAAFPAAPYTRNLGGYGLALLELNDGADTRSAYLYYGGPETGHEHADRLNLAYFVHGREVLPDLGYPSHWGPVATYWVNNTPSHYGVLVNGRAQTSRVSGYLTRFADLDGLKLATADGLAAWGEPPPSGGAHHVATASLSAPDRPPAPSVVQAYQRTLALLDTGEKSSLLIDAFLVRGGHQHDYSFHGLPFGEFSTALPLRHAQATGTLAGETIGYGEDPGHGRAQGGYQFFMKPRWYTPEDVTRLDWKNDQGLNQATWFPRLGFDEVIVADTTPPLTPGYPASMPYVLLRHQSSGEGEDLASLFLGVTDVEAGPVRVKSVQRLTAGSPAAGGAVVQLDPAHGSTWRIYVNESGGPVKFSDGTEGDLSFAAIRLVDGQPVSARYVGAGHFRSPGLPDFQQESVAFQVQSVDYTAGTVRLAAPFPFTPGPRGLVVCAQTGPNSQSYTIRSVANDATGATLGFGEIGLITGRFRCTWDAAHHRLVSQERTAGDYNQFNGKSFPGMTAIGPGFSATATITGYDRAANAFTLAVDDTTAARLVGEDTEPGATRDRDSARGAYVYLADIAPGTMLRVTPAQVVDFRR